MADYLDEDVVISSQKYCIFSYVLPQEDLKGKKPKGHSTPMIKIRGTASSIEECEARIKRLQTTDKYFNIYVLETGKWSALLTDEQIKEKDVDVVYRNEQINNFMKGYKEQKDKTDQHYEERKEMMKKQAQLEGTKEGQKKLAEEEENPISVKNRRDESLKVIKKLQKDLYEFQDMYEQAKVKYSNFSEEQIEQSERDFEQLKIKNE